MGLKDERGGKGSGFFGLLPESGRETPTPFSHLELHLHVHLIAGRECQFLEPIKVAEFHEVSCRVADDQSMYLSVSLVQLPSARSCATLLSVRRVHGGQRIIALEHSLLLESRPGGGGCLGFQFEFFR